ncbi:MAG TPA: glycosyltransferase family 4 protein [Anaerolineae bacterium]|nr:glycosyltransferase family 4 protein [Anaerolineae bacterium]HNT05109.1 glycosyltransferase family 4 protein [Anaerolineae bacterium]
MTAVRALELVASSRGGGAAHVRDLAAGLQQLGYDVWVGMAQDGGNVRPEDLEAKGVTCHRLDFATGFSVSALARLRGLLADVRILHLHGARAALFGRLALLSLPRGRRPRSIYTIHGFAAPHYAFARRQLLLGVERLLAPATDWWVCVSNAERQALLSTGIADPLRVQVIWNGIDTSRFTPERTGQSDTKRDLGLPVDAYVATTICRLFRPRDFGTLLAAFRSVKSELDSAHLLIVGDGPLRSEVENQVRALQLKSSVHLLGMRRDIPRLLQASDVLVLSSRGWEGLPLTVLEAMASALPVIASDVGGTCEALQDGETGYLYPPGDAATLASLLLRLAGDPALAAAMGRSGLARVRQYFGVGRMVQETAALYERLV